MKSKRKYTQAEMEGIRELLIEKSNASRSRQKSFRGKIRTKFGFYISDFTLTADAFTHSDLDRLISNGRIQIVDSILQSSAVEFPKKQVNVPTVAIESKPKTPRNNTDKITWAICQELSDLILADGLEKLKTAEKQHFGNTYTRTYGNYLFSNSGKPYYIGESKNLNNRLKQHSKESTSTFFKNYLRKYGSQAYLEITDFDIQLLKTSIGRKEVEEFGIVNLPTILNKFQKGKRKRFSKVPENSIWEKVQQCSDRLIAEGEKDLFLLESISWENADIPNSPGLYYIEHDNDGLIYIGESSNIRDRYKTHCGTTYFSALRRHIGTDLLDFELQTRNGKKRYFSESEDLSINRYQKKCSVKAMTIYFGRFELEEYLIRKFNPRLNRKENK